MGAILFLSHDRDSRVVYPSLNDFLRAVETTKNVGRRFSEIHPLHSPVPSNQAALSEFVLRQLDIGGATEAIAAVIPSMDLHDLALLRRLAKDDDFFLGEAVGI